MSTNRIALTQEDLRHLLRGGIVEQADAQIIISGDPGFYALASELVEAAEKLYQKNNAESRVGITRTKPDPRNGPTYDA